jgi:hypothetical protein
MLKHKVRDFSTLNQIRFNNFEYNNCKQSRYSKTKHLFLRIQWESEKVFKQTKDPSIRSCFESCVENKVWYFKRFECGWSM